MSNGTADLPWSLSTPSGRGSFVAWRDAAADPAQLVVQVGKTRLAYRLRCLDDLHAMLVAHGDWMPLGSKDEQKDAVEGTVEAWGRDTGNPVGGWYGLKRGLRGRFANYVPPVLALQGRVEFQKVGRTMMVRAC
jgi:hypothetical protein